MRPSGPDRLSATAAGPARTPTSANQEKSTAEHLSMSGKEEAGGVAVVSEPGKRTGRYEIVVKIGPQVK